MDRSETKNLLSRIKEAYPSGFARMSKDEMISMLDVWTQALAKCDRTTVEYVAEKWISKNGKMPNIGQLLDLVNAEESLLYYALKLLRETDEARN